MNIQRTRLDPARFQPASSAAPRHAASVAVAPMASAAAPPARATSGCPFLRGHARHTGVGSYSQLWLKTICCRPSVPLPCAPPGSTPSLYGGFAVPASLAGPASQDERQKPRFWETTQSHVARLQMCQWFFSTGRQRCERCSKASQAKHLAGLFISARLGLEHIPPRLSAARLKGSVGSHR